MLHPFFHFRPQDQRMRWLHLQKFEKGWRGLTSVLLLRLLGQSWDEGSGCANSALCWWGTLWQGQRFAHVFPQHKMERMKNENLLSHRRIATTLLEYLDSRLLPILSMVRKACLGHNQWFHKKQSLANSHQSRIPFMATASTSATHETFPHLPATNWGYWQLGDLVLLQHVQNIAITFSQLANCLVAW